MADFSTKTFTQLVQDQAAAIQARAAGLVDFSVGSLARAFAEAVASVVLWLQALILALLATTRASTSEGADLDSWMADFGAAELGGAEVIVRLPAQVATGQVTFSRRTASGQATVPVGSTIETADGGAQFVVVADVSFGTYNQDLAAYVLADTVASVAVPVQAVTAGAAGNVAAGQANTITSAITGIDSVTNAAAFQNGYDAETDDEFRARFRTIIAGLRKATPPALAAAVTSLRRGATCRIVEFQNHDTTAHVAYFYAIVDDGTGYPSSDLLTAAGLLLDATRAGGISFSTYAPSVVTVDVAGVITLAATAIEADALAAAVTAVTDFINTLPGGVGLARSRVIQLILDATSEITKVPISTLTLNAATDDIVVTANQTLKAGAVGFTT